MGSGLHVAQLGIDLGAIRIDHYCDLGGGWDQFVQKSQMLRFDRSNEHCPFHRISADTPALSVFAGGAMKHHQGRPSRADKFHVQDRL
jgi:hypothetical protein